MTKLSITLLLLLFSFLLFCSGCGHESDTPSKEVNDLVSQPSLDQVLQVVPNDANSDIDALRQSAANNHPEAQRELAKRLLLGDGVPADPAAATRWARRAALNGDELTALWTGRAALNEPIDRIEAGAWFMIAQQAQEAFVREDATGEMEALNLTEDELKITLDRATELKQLILIGSEECGNFQTQKVKTTISR